MNRILGGMVLALCAAVAMAAGPSAVRKQAEASMLVTGHVLIEPDGSVSGWEIDQRDKLPAAVVGLVEQSVDVWRFEPVVVDGLPRNAKARMSLRVVATKVDGGYRVGIRGGHFGLDAMAFEERSAIAGTDLLRPVQLKPPAYPLRAQQSGVEGTVYVIVLVNRQGVVEDAIAEQINLKTLGSERQMEQMRTVLATPALEAARKWTFQVPTTGEDAEQPHWTARVPVAYGLGDPQESKYGEWEAYIPGPRHESPWGPAGDRDPNESPDALVAGAAYQVGKGLRLLTPLQGGG